MAGLHSEFYCLPRIFIRTPWPRKGGIDVLTQKVGMGIEDLLPLIFYGEVINIPTFFVIWRSPVVRPSSDVRRGANLATSFSFRHDPAIRAAGSSPSRTGC
jgi:hypothetical protein